MKVDKFVYSHCNLSNNLNPLRIRVYLFEALNSHTDVVDWTDYQTLKRFVKKLRLKRTGKVCKLSSNMCNKWGNAGSIAGFGFWVDRSEYEFKQFQVQNLLGLSIA